MTPDRVEGDRVEEGDTQIDKPDEATRLHQPGEGRTRKLPFLLILVVPIIMILQGAAGLISVRTGFFSQQLVQQGGFLIFMLIGAPVMAIVGWQNLIGDSNLRYHWEARLLAACTVIFIFGCDAFGITELIHPALVQTSFSDVLLYATLISFALLLFSVLVMLLRVGFSALAHKRQTRSSDER